MSYEQDSGVASYWALGGTCPPRLPTSSFLVHFGLNLRVSYPSIVKSARSADADVNNSQLFRSVLHQSQNCYVIEQLLHPTRKSTMSSAWHNFHLFPSSQQILATPLEQERNKHTDIQTDRLQFVMQPFIGRTAFCAVFLRHVFFCSTYTYMRKTSAAAHIGYFRSRRHHINLLRPLLGSSTAISVTVVPTFRAAADLGKGMACHWDSGNWK